MAEKPLAFVIMPFDTEFILVYEQLITPALEDAGYDVARADSFLEQQNILKDVVGGIARADLLVADLTALNPNVLYELGLSHAFRIPTIMLTQSIEELPFDLRSYRVLEYSVRFDLAHKLKDALNEIGERHTRRDIEFGSPVTDFYPADLEPKESHASVKVGNGEAVEEKGFLDFIVEGQQAGEHMNKSIEAIGNETVVIGEKLGGYSKQIAALNASPGPGTASRIYKLAKASATDMSEFAGNLRRIQPDLDASVELLSESYGGYLGWMQISNDEEKKSLVEFRGNIESLLGSTGSALVSTREFRDTAAGLRGISKDINTASRRVTGALDGVVSSLERVEAFCARILQIIDERLEE